MVLYCTEKSCNKIDPYEIRLIGKKIRTVELHVCKVDYIEDVLYQVHREAF